MPCNDVSYHVPQQAAGRINQENLDKLTPENVERIATELGTLSTFIQAVNDDGCKVDSRDRFWKDEEKRTEVE